MHAGLSLLLEDMFEASELTHFECELLKIACPSCRDLLHKVVRPTGTGETHYFAHSEGAPDDCPLRADRWGDDTPVGGPSFPRPPEPDAFFRRHLDAVLSALYSGGVRARAVELATRFQQSAVFPTFKQTLLAIAQALPRSSGETRLQHIAGAAAPADSSQKQIAWTLWRRFVSRGGTDFDFLLVHAFVQAVLAAEAHASEAMTNYDRSRTEVLTRFGAGEDGFELFRSLDILFIDWEAEQVIRPGDRLRLQVVDLMLATLLRLPYADLFRGRTLPASPPLTPGHAGA